MTSFLSEPIVLASTSATRHRILENASVPFEAVRHFVDEEEIKLSLIKDQISGGDIAVVLAEQKARYVSRQRPGCLIVGADQTLELDGRIFNKPENIKEAQLQLTELRGSEHVLYSCVCVVRDQERLWHQLDRARLTMRNFSDEFLQDYIESMGDKLLCGPGGYQIEGMGAQLFTKVVGDYFTILGLPLNPLLNFLRLRGALKT